MSGVNWRITVDLTILLDSLFAAFGGILGGFVLSRSLDKTQDRSHRITAIAISGICGHYIGYIAARWAFFTYDWLTEGDFVVAAAMGFVTGAVVPSGYKVFLEIMKQARSDPKSWISFLAGLFKGK